MTGFRLKVGVVAILAIILAIAHASYSARADVPPLALRELDLYWGEKIDRLGPQRAYDEFKDYYSTSLKGSHFAAHTMGNQLYKKLGLKGISFCDESFGYGCYHGLLGQALVEMGPESIKKAVGDICDLGLRKKQSGCTHGAGHGILEYFGGDDILKGLETCTYLFGEGSEGGCPNGVFMDYNAPFSSDGTHALYRPFDPHHPLSPCDRAGLPTRFLDACYISLASYVWDSVGGIAGVADLCAKAPASRRAACYSGIGIQLPGSVGYVQDTVIAECDRLIADEKIRWCLAQSATTTQQFGKSACKIYEKLGVSKDHDCP